jgi:hypothetical protein
VKKIILFLIWIIGSAGLVYYLYSHASDLKRLLAISIQDVILLIMLLIIMQYFNGPLLKFILEKVDTPLTPEEYFYFTSMNTAANYLPLRGEAAATAGAFCWIKYF